MKSQKLLLFVALNLSAASAFAGGFQINEHGARQTGMVGTFVATADDPSAVFYNPAGLVNVKGKQISLGTTFITYDSQFAGKNPSPGVGTSAAAKTGYFFPSTFYYTHQLNENSTLGLGFFNPFGLGNAWDEDGYLGRFRLREVDLKSFYINPSYAFRAGEHLSIGIGLDIIWAQFKLEKEIALAIDPNTTQVVNAGTTLLEGNSDLALGWNAGILANFENVRLGLSYRHEVANEVNDKDATFDITLPSSDPFYASAVSRLKNQTFDSELTFPSTLMLGVAYQFTEKVYAEVDWSWVGWSSFDKLEFRFEDEALNQTIPEDYKDVWNLRFGIEWKAHEQFDVRYGYLYDRSPVPDGAVSPLLPGSDRHNFSVGLGWHINENMDLDISDMLVLFDDRDTNGQSHDNIDGEYRTRINLVGLSFTYKF